MSQATIQIPPLNQIRFVPYQPAKNPRYNSTLYDDDLFINTQQYWQISGKTFYQPIQLGDPITIQVHTSTNPTYPPKLELVNCVTKTVVVNVNTTAYYLGTFAITGNLAPDTGNQLDTSLWKARASQLTSNTQGFYQFVLTTYDTTGAIVDIRIGEPMNIRTSHPNTLFISYKPRTSQHIIMDWPTGIVPTFGKRIYGDLREFRPAGNAMDYKDVGYDQHQLDAVAWRTFKLNISGHDRVPWYEIDKMNWIIMSEQFSIEGKPYIYVNDNSSSSGGTSLWNIQDPVTSLFIGGSVLIRERKITDSFTSTVGKILLFTSPGGAIPTYPFALKKMEMDSFILTCRIGCRIIEDSAGQIAFLAYLNSTFLDLYDLTGTFTYDSATGNWYYVFGAGEYFYFSNAPTATRLLNTALTMTGGDSWGYNVNGGWHVADWGDSTGPFMYDTPVLTLVSHTYAGAGSYTQRIFSDDNMVTLQYNVATGKATAFTGEVSAALTTFYCIFQNLGSVNPSFLNTATGLQELQLPSNAITGFTPKLFHNTSGFYFKNMRYVSVVANNLVAADIDQICNDFVDMVWQEPSGISAPMPSSAHFPTFSGQQVLLNGQSPAAVRTSASSNLRDWEGLTHSTSAGTTGTAWLCDFYTD